MTTGYERSDHEDYREPCYCGRPGWMNGLRHVPAAVEHTAGSRGPAAICSHIMQGWQSTMVEWARNAVNNGVSYHFTAGRNGTGIQHVSLTDQAWHVGRYDVGADPTWPLWPGSRSDNMNDFLIGIAGEGWSADPGYPVDYVYANAPTQWGGSRMWPEPMQRMFIVIHKWAAKELSIPADREHFIGHHEIRPVSRAHDPGSGWPIDRIIREVAAEQEIGPVVPDVFDPPIPPRAPPPGYSPLTEADITVGYLKSAKVSIDLAIDRLEQ